MTVNAPPAFQALHHNDGYGVGYSLGTTTAGTPGLLPEHSRNITAGIVFQPRPNLSFTIDYYNIRKTGVIAPADYTPALAAYFAGQPIPPGFKVTPGLPDPNYPNLMPLPGFVQFGFQNLNALKTSGFDFSAQARYRLPWNITWITDLEGTFVENYDLYLPDGTVEHFAGTIGPYNTTSASGTPQYRANWQNTLDFGHDTLSLHRLLYLRLWRGRRRHRAQPGLLRPERPLRNASDLRRRGDPGRLPGRGDVGCRAARHP